MRSFLPLRSLTAKLGLVLFGLVFVVMAVLLLVVVPRLESRLVDARVDRLERAAVPVMNSLPQNLGRLRASEDLAVLGARHEARIVVLERLGSDSLLVFADSTLATAPAFARDPLALRVLETGTLERGRVDRNGRALAEVAFPVEGRVVVLSAPLADVLRTFELLRSSLLVAGGVALIGAALLAYMAAWGLTRRLRRLESAAEQIAAGDFSQPIVDHGRDQVAELARAFDNMRERLAHLERARREFIQNASHELRTPLFSLGGFLELLEDEDLDDATRREFLAETRAQIDRLARLATDLLDLSRLDAGQLAVTAESFDMSETARIAVDEFRAVAEASGHDLRVAADTSVDAIADPQRTLQVARILIQNALRHTPAGTPVAVTTARNDGGALLTVRDRGPGIAPEAVPHLFERFYRAEGGRASGSGLGLAIASELARRMDGELSVDSEPRSTAFVLRLPAAPVEPEGPFSHETAASSRERTVSRA